jgi:hypothetical protein
MRPWACFFPTLNGNGRLQYDELLVINSTNQYVGRLTVRNILTCYFPTLFATGEDQIFAGKQEKFTDLAILMEDSFQKECRRLWETGAAKWLAVNWLVLLQKAPAIIFILGMAFFVLVMTNFIMNVAAIAISLPVALVIAPYLGVAGEVILFLALAVAGMPFLLLIGAAPNAIAYNSKQFTPGEFFKYDLLASALLMVVLWVFVAFVWPMMGMQVFTAVQ